MRDFIGNADREHFILICLNSKNEPTHIETVSIGTINFAVIHPREISRCHNDIIFVTRHIAWFWTKVGINR
ncbi:JAB domain-containing protein [Staphylococcus pseudintermedius]|nr:JAB domain-containing protein [Staphylococcus pseudintermedius]